MNRTTKKLITDIRKYAHSDDVTLLCVRAEELMNMCNRLERALHEAIKALEAIPYEITKHPDL